MDKGILAAIIYGFIVIALVALLSQGGFFLTRPSR